jgi:hypothetical protein
MHCTSTMKTILETIGAPPTVLYCCKHILLLYFDCLSHKPLSEVLSLAVNIKLWVIIASA